MTELYLLEPEEDERWLPFFDCRPISELRAGAWLIRERWEGLADGSTAAIFGPEHLHSFVELECPTVMASKPVTGPALVGRSNFAPTGFKPDLPETAACLVNDDETVGWWIPAGTTWAGPDEDWPAIELEGVLLHGAYDALTATEHLLSADVADFVHGDRDEIPDGCLIVGDPAEVIILGATVEPGTVFDVRKGAIVLEDHCYIKSGTRLEGPLYVGAGTQIHGGPVGNSSIGPICRVRGEMTATVMLGFSNKGHDGFIGHSLIGRWVNLGAGTTTSNLKNTYGDIRLQLGESVVETGRNFLGTVFGDHVKTAIGTMFSTGSVVGAGASVFGSQQPAKYVSPFAWGDAGEPMNIEGFLKTAEHVFKRRQETFGDEQLEMLTSIYRKAI
jgi:UDP-N-acetylglucosamine diphosphorylase/glucosamine-1-phosphate N-acetyltransferase